MSNEQWMKLASPGPHHEILKATAGTFDTTAEFWMAPGAPPARSTGRIVNTLILGGRALQHSYKGSMMEMPYEGWGSLSYDNAAGLYVGTWMDTMSTMLQIHKGPAGADPMVIDLAADLAMPGFAMKSRHITRVIDNDHMVFEIHHGKGDEPMRLVGRIQYTRAKA